MQLHALANGSISYSQQVIEGHKVNSYSKLLSYMLTSNIGDPYLATRVMLDPQV